MKKSILICAASLLLSSAAWPEEGKGGAPRYYYPVPHTESVDWAYQVPTCKELAQNRYATLKAAKQCQVLRTGIESCESEEKVVLENMTNDQTASFRLRYIVLNSLVACQRDREKYLRADQ